MQYGKIISAKEAQEYFTQYSKSKEGTNHQNKIFKKLPPNTSQIPNVKNNDLANAYSGCQINTFIFSKEIILQLLETPDSSGKTADFLAVHFAAKLPTDVDNGKEGEPTIVVLGCRQPEANKETFSSMSNQSSAAEHPGGVTTFNYQPLGLHGDGQITITFD